MSAKIGLILPLFLFGGLSIKVLIYDVRLLYVVVLMLLVVYSKKIILYSFFRKELLLIALPIPTLLLFILFQRLAGVQSNYTISLVMSLVVFQGVVLLGYFYYVDVRKERHSKFVYFSIVALIIILLSEKLLGVGYVSSYLLRGLNETLFVMLGFYVLAIQMNPDKRKVHLLLGFVLFVTAYYLSARAISFLVLMGMGA